MIGYKFLFMKTRLECTNYFQAEHFD